MPEITLAAYALYMIVVFGLRSIAHRRKTGSVGFNGFDADFGSLPWFGGILFYVAFVLTPLAAILDWTGSLIPIDFLDQPWARTSATFLYGLGLVGTLAAQFAMGESWRMGVDATERTALVTNGPFAFARNPMFTGLLLTWGGLGLMSPNLAGALGFIAMLCAIEIQVRLVEEPYLRATHGTVYDDYARRVGRFLPAIGRAKSRISQSGGLGSQA